MSTRVGQEAGGEGRSWVRACIVVSVGRHRPIPPQSSSTCPWSDWDKGIMAWVEYKSPREEVAGDVGPEWLSLHLKGTLQGELCISKLATPGKGKPSNPARTQMSKHQIQKIKDVVNTVI